MPLSRPIPVGVAVRVEILVDASQNPVAASVLIDGELASPTIELDPQLVIGSTPKLSLHLTSYDDAPSTLTPVTFHFDDVLVETK